MKAYPYSGTKLINSTRYNKDSAFTEAEREEYGMEGLLPPAISTMELQIKRVLANIERKENDIEKYVFLQSLAGRNDTLFYRLLMDHIESLMPIVYTPTVGQACSEFAQIYRGPRGFYITPKHRGRIAEILDNWPEKDVRMIVVTDGERILGLGDLGANGMGIPIGKLALYTALAGVPPSQCLPVMIDVGTNNQTLRDDPLYLGLNQPRITGDEYDSLIDEFVQAVQTKYPKALIQFEDFVTPNAYRLLNRYRDQVLCFNDDIQGTAAVALAGILASCRLTGRDFTELDILFLGAGSAATGIGELICSAMVAAGSSEEEARKRLWFTDRQGVVVASRDELADHVLPFAHDHAPMSFEEAIDTIQPHILIGATGTPGVFTETVIHKMSQNHIKPVIFALSNPTSRAECTAVEAYRWSEGRAIFASGSPFDPVHMNGQDFVPGQGNNAYVFPGIGLGALAAEARIINDDMFLAAAQALAEQVTEDDLAQGTLYPSLKRIREVSLAIAIAVVKTAQRDGLVQADLPDDLATYIQSLMYDPHYS